MNSIKFLKMDLRLMLKSMRTFILFPLVALILISFGNTTFGITYIFFFMIILNTVPFTVEGNNNCSRLYYAMPSKISDMVLGRYLYSLVMALVVWIIAGTSLYIASTNGSITTIELFTSIVSGATIMVMTMIQYPLYYKFGIQKARILSMLIYLLPAVIVFALPSIFKSSSGIASIDITQISIYLVIGLIVVVACYISYRVSYKICANKEL